MDRKQKDKLLVHGYIKQITNLNIPSEIIDLCFVWYHIDSYFFKTGMHCKINRSKNKVSIGSYGKGSCYGSILMNSARMTPCKDGGT